MGRGRAVRDRERRASAPFRGPRSATRRPEAAPVGSASQRPGSSRDGASLAETLDDTRGRSRRDRPFHASSALAPRCGRAPPSRQPRIAPGGAPTAERLPRESDSPAAEVGRVRRWIEGEPATAGAKRRGIGRATPDLRCPRRPRERGGADRRPRRIHWNSTMSARARGAFLLPPRPKRAGPTDPRTANPPLRRRVRSRRPNGVGADRCTRRRARPARRREPAGTFVVDGATGPLRTRRGTCAGAVMSRNGRGVRCGGEGRGNIHIRFASTVSRTHAGACHPRRPCV